jgi:hypothetical protein
MLRDRMGALNQAVVSRFDSLLEAAGYDSATDYSDLRWIARGSLIGEVRDGFPAITPRALPRGVEKVRYQLSVREISAFAITASQLCDAVKGAGL